MIPYSLNPLGIDPTYDDLYWLRKIRDANPASQLPSWWLDSEDPYTEWEGVTWNAEKTRCVNLDVNSKNITTLQNVNKLTALTYFDCASNQLTSLDVTGLTALTELYFYYNQLTTLDLTGCTALTYFNCISNQLITLDLTGLNALTYLDCSSNQLTALDITGLTRLLTLDCAYNQFTSIPTLMSKGSIVKYNFTYNNFPTSELDRFRAMGFTDESKLLPQNP